jgi:peptidoglycan/xylan/chitin deacetylase (PgdA/CDA1 family)
MTAAVSLASCKGGEDEKGKGADSTKPVVHKAGPGDPIKYDSSKRYIFLTWDDSPQPPGTDTCKAIFKRQGVKATFFMVGMHVIDQRRKNLVAALRSDYPNILVANHSYTHGFRNNYKHFYSHPDSAVNDFLKAQEELKIPLKIIRLPGNNSWVGKGELQGPHSTYPVCKKLDSLGYNVIGWDIEWRFKGGNVPIQSADQMVQEVNDKFETAATYKPNAVVILAHDRMFAKAQYADSLNKFIATLKQDPRNVFETLDHYPLVQQNK